MMSVMALHLIGLSVVFAISLATPFPLHISLEGSAEEEESGHLSPTPSLPSPSSPAFKDPTTPGAPSHTDKVFVDQVVEFLEENLLLICVMSTLIFLILLIICCSVFMSRRQKVNAYYPSSFPSKMYVDQRDKNGGLKPFNEVPEKPANGPQHQPTDSGKQLQADIMMAVKKLRTPTKPPPKEREEREPEASEAADQSPEASRQEDSTGQDSQTAADREVLCQVSDEETAAGRSSPEVPVAPPEPAGLEQDESAQSSSDPQASEDQQEPSPFSQHDHSDCPATPPLITGEKTAF